MRQYEGNNNLFITVGESTINYTFITVGETTNTDIFITVDETTNNYIVLQLVRQLIMTCLYQFERQLIITFYAVGETTSSGWRPFCQVYAVLQPGLLWGWGWPIWHTLSFGKRGCKKVIKFNFWVIKVLPFISLIRITYGKSNYFKATFKTVITFIKIKIITAKVFFVCECVLKWKSLLLGKDSEVVPNQN